MNKENIVLMGISNLHYATFKLNDADPKKIVYETPTPIKGTISLQLKAEGEGIELKADNRIYYSQSSFDGYKGDIELAYIPESFRLKVLGSKKDQNGAIIENTMDNIVPVAIMGEINGDKRNRRIVLYDCLITRPSEEAKTLEKDVSTTKFELTVKPRETDGTIKAFLERTEENKTVFDNFFKTVYEPVFQGR